MKYAHGKNPNSRNGFEKGHKTNLGFKHSEEAKTKIKEWMTGRYAGNKHFNYGKTDENTSGWKGDDAGCGAIHLWVERKKGKAKDCKCEHCDKQARDWANIDHKYRRILKDYIALCRKCHIKYDKKT